MCCPESQYIIGPNQETCGTICSGSDYAPPTIEKQIVKELNLFASDDKPTESIFLVNASLSTPLIKQLKIDIALNGIQDIKHIAYFDYDYKTETLNGKTINDRDRIDEQECDTCKKLLLNFKNSKLTVSEKQNLYLNLQNQIISHNPLNLYLSLETIIKKFSLDKKLEVPSYMIDSVIAEQLKIAIDTILLNSSFSDEINNFSYTEAFQFAYYFISLNLQLQRNYLLEISFASIQLLYQPYFKSRTGDDAPIPN